MNITATYFLDVTSSWCYWAEPAWAELKARYANKPVEFTWKIALLDEAALPKSHAQVEWFYRRSGMVMRSPFMLNPNWHDAGLKEYLAPNCIAEAAKDFKVIDDRARLALAHAGLREGEKIGRWEVASQIVAKATGLEVEALRTKAQSAEIEKRVRASTAEFHGLQVTERPTFTLRSSIGDRAIFSGFAKAGPIAAAIDSMLDDAAAYASHAAHFGPLPP